YQAKPLIIKWYWHYPPRISLSTSPRVGAPRRPPKRVHLIAAAALSERAASSVDLASASPVSGRHARCRRRAREHASQERAALGRSHPPGVSKRKPRRSVRPMPGQIVNDLYRVEVAVHRGGPPVGSGRTEYRFLQRRAGEGSVPSRLALSVPRK